MTDGQVTGSLSRRHFMHCAACATTAAGMGALPASALAASPASATLKGKEAMREFAYGKVKLTGGRLKRQFDHIHAHFLALDNVALKVRRVRSMRCSARTAPASRP